MTEFKKRCFVFFVLTLYLFAFSLLCYAETIKTVEGLIDNISSDSIKVKGTYYNISDVPLKDASGKSLTKNEIKVGKRVEIIFYKDRITSVIIHGYLVD